MKINKEQLQAALEKVRPGLASRETVEQSTSFAFVGNRVVTYNDEISVSHPVENLDVVGAVKAQALYEFLNKIKKEEIDIEWEENQVIIKAGRSKAGLVLEQEVKLPIEEEIGEISKWKKLPENFIEALKFCHPCCSRDLARPILTCVHVDKDKVEASDSYQIVVYKLDGKFPIKNCLIPAPAARELVRYNIKETAESESWIHFKTEDGTIFSSRVLDSEFPDTSHHLEIEGVEFEFPKNADQILQRANVFSKKEINAGDVPPVTIEVKNQRVKISAKNESGWFEEESRVKYDGEPFKFAAGVEFLEALFGKVQNCIIGPDKIGFSGENWQHIVAMLAREEED